MIDPKKLHGILPVYKPAGISSHHLVKQARHLLKEKKIGHAGTLDPFAQGLLLLLIGEATKLQAYFMRLPKTYFATFFLGKETDTLDPTGKIISQNLAPAPPIEKIKNCIASKFTGEIQQTPPVFSAVKVAGKRAYALARKNIDFSLERKTVTIHTWQPLTYSNRILSCKIQCSSGTYIRALARDLGYALNTNSYLLTLTRSEIGSFSHTLAQKLEKFQNNHTTPTPHILEAEKYLQGAHLHLPLHEIPHLIHGRIQYLAPAIQKCQPLPLLLFAQNKLIMILKKENNKIKIMYNRTKEFITTQHI